MSELEELIKKHKQEAREKKEAAKDELSAAYDKHMAESPDGFQPPNPIQTERFVKAIKADPTFDPRANMSLKDAQSYVQMVAITNAGIAAMVEMEMPVDQLMILLQQVAGVE